MRKFVFWIAWLVIVSVGVVTLLLGQPGLNLNTLQRLAGLTAFSLLFMQIILGGYMNFFTDKLGGWVFGFHVKQGVAIYTLIVLHPILFLLQKPPLVTLANPFYLMGTLSFILISLAVWAARMRAEPFWNIHWRKFHILNYVAFLLIVVHAFNVGSDFKSFPFSVFYPMATLAVLVTIVYRVRTFFRGRRGAWRAHFAGRLKPQG